MALMRKGLNGKENQDKPRKKCGLLPSLRSARWPALWLLGGLSGGLFCCAPGFAAAEQALGFDQAVRETRTELRQLAAEDYFDAAFILAYLDEQGLGAPADIHAAMAQYRHLIQEALRVRAKANIESPGDDFDGESVHNELSGELPPVYAVTALRLGRLYRDGAGLPEQASKAVDLFRLAAEQGLAAAQTEMGLAYETGRGVKKSVAKAVHWYGLAARQQDADAAYHLGNLYAAGNDMTQDFVQAADHWKTAAAQGHAAARKALALLYVRGLGVPQQRILACALLAALESQDRESVAIRRVLRKNLGAHERATCQDWQEAMTSANNAQSRLKQWAEWERWQNSSAIQANKTAEP